MAKSKIETETVVDSEFVLDRETKGTFRYAEVLKNQGDRPPIGSLYITKPTFQGKPPGKIRVVVTAVEE